MDMTYESKKNCNLDSYRIQTSLSSITSNNIHAQPTILKKASPTQVPSNVGYPIPLKKRKRKQSFDQQSRMYSQDVNFIQDLSDSFDQPIFYPRIKTPVTTEHSLYPNVIRFSNRDEEDRIQKDKTPLCPSQISNLLMDISALNLHTENYDKEIFCRDKEDRIQKEDKTLMFSSQISTLLMDISALNLHTENYDKKDCADVA